jgi:hypothetical protein
MEKEILMKNGKYTTQDIEFKTIGHVFKSA